MDKFLLKRHDFFQVCDSGPGGLELVLQQVNVIALLRCRDCFLNVIKGVSFARDQPAIGKAQFVMDDCQIFCTGPLTH